jgi:hypothetical protein
LLAGQGERLNAVIKGGKWATREGI